MRKDDDDKDVVSYHKIKTTDECLDAMNDLNMLFIAFGDEAYLQLLEVVEHRLRRLVNAG